MPLVATSVVHKTMSSVKLLQVLEFLFDKKDYRIFKEITYFIVC